MPFWWMMCIPLLVEDRAEVSMMNRSGSDVLLQQMHQNLKFWPQG